MKNQKILRRVERGCWELIGTARNRLHAIKEGKSVIAMSTRMGVMICSRSESVFDNELINEEISLVITSPPYILRCTSVRRYFGRKRMVRVYHQCNEENQAKACRWSLYCTAKGKIRSSKECQPEKLILKGLPS